MSIKHFCRSNPLAVIFIVIIVLAGLYAGLSARTPKGYSVVYLVNGELYVGKLSTFPRWKLTDGYIFQVTRDSGDTNRNNFQLAPVKEALWAPEYLSINPEQVLFSGPLSEASGIMQTLVQNAGGGTVAPVPASSVVPEVESIQ